MLKRVKLLFMIFADGFDFGLVLLLYKLNVFHTSFYSISLHELLGKLRNNLCVFFRVFSSLRLEIFDLLSLIQDSFLAVRKR